MNKLAKKSNLAFDYHQGTETADVVVFIHGLGGSRAAFKCCESSKDLSPFNKIFIGLVGFGESSSPEGYDYDLENQADEIKALLFDLFPNQEFHLVGHSMGGAIATILANHLEKRCLGLISIEGNLVGTDCGLFSRIISEQNREAFISDGFETFCNSEPSWKDLRRTTAEAFYDSAKSLVSWSDSGKLLELFLKSNAPNYFLYGQLSSQTEALPSLNKDVVFEISRSAHAVMEDNPEEFISVLARLLKMQKDRRAV